MIDRETKDLMVCLLISNRNGNFRIGINDGFTYKFEA